MALLNLQFYLLSLPAYHRLRQEADAVFLRGENPTDQERLVRMKFLNACISETLDSLLSLPTGPNERPSRR